EPSDSESGAGKLTHSLHAAFGPVHHIEAPFILHEEPRGCHHTREVDVHFVPCNAVRSKCFERLIIREIRRVYGNHIERGMTEHLPDLSDIPGVHGDLVCLVIETYAPFSH